MITQTLNIKDKLASDGFIKVKGEELSLEVISDQVLTSSKIAASTYNKVVFSNCTFYACDFNSIDFNDCIFENCTFEFTHFRQCNFKNCNFSSCKWKGSSSINCIYEACDLGKELKDLCQNGKNTLISGKRDYSTDIYIQPFALAS